MCNACGCTPCSECDAPVEDSVCSGCGEKPSDCSCELLAEELDYEEQDEEDYDDEQDEEYEDEDEDEEDEDDDKDW